MKYKLSYAHANKLHQVRPGKSKAPNIYKCKLFILYLGWPYAV